MKGLFASLGRIFARLFRSRTANAKRSRLVSRYMSQANGRNAMNSEMSSTRERRNSRYSYSRERV